ncbi:MAG: hypothetical protein SW833_19285 [Cyanobacteriota bacterium]|nr:hypothetical protein [Cyanobacteriota bacterium]
MKPMGIKIETAIQIEKPGAKPGQVILAIDLTKIKFPVKALSVVKNIGYSPKLKLVKYASGVRALAILKDERFESSIPEEYLEEEWMKLQEIFDANAVHLWCGRSAKNG